MPLLPMTHVVSLWLAFAMALSVPVIGWCAGARHLGQGLHPIFEHVHAVDTPAEQVAMGHTTELVHSHEEPGTSWSASSVFGTGAPGDGVSILAPRPLAAMVSLTHARFVVDLPHPTSFMPAPVAPPPRPTR